MLVSLRTLSHGPVEAKRPSYLGFPLRLIHRGKNN
jgi:hypothetical protein